MKIILLFVLLISSGLIYCQTSDPGVPDLSVERLLAAPLSITIEGKQLQLEPGMTIDYMPKIPPKPKTVRTNCYLTTVDKSELPPSVEADAIWIVYKRGEIFQHPNSIKPIRTDTSTLIWKSWLKEDTGYNYKYKKLYRASEGNFLSVGGTADLIVRIKDDRGNKWLIRTRATVTKVQ